MVRTYLNDLEEALQKKKKKTWILEKPKQDVSHAWTRAEVKNQRFNLHLKMQHA